MKTEPAIVLATETIPERYIDPQEAARFLTISPEDTNATGARRTRSCACDRSPNAPSLALSEIGVGHLDARSTTFKPPPALSSGGNSLRRARYQEGCLTRSKRKTGDVWEFRFRECQPDGTRKMRCVVVGPVARYRTRTAALHQIEVLRANVNRELVDPQSPVLTTFKLLVDHYRQKEMGMDNHLKKAYSTKKRNETVLKKWIVPRWGDYRPADIKSVAVEEWLDSLVHDHRDKDKGKPLSPGTKVKIRNLMSAIFRHGMRYEFLPRVEEANPMKYVRQSGKRQGIPVVLEVEQFQQLFAA